MCYHPFDMYITTQETSTEKRYIIGFNSREMQTLSDEEIRRRIYEVFADVRTRHGYTPVEWARAQAVLERPALVEMTQRQRQVLELRVGEGMTLEEVAERLGLSRQMVHRHDKRAREILAGLDGSVRLTGARVW